MAYQALYRQWRPATFSQVLGQEAVVRTLKNQIQSGRIAHAYLFCGCRGTGKTTLAKIMSRAINCLSPADGEPCGHCASCQAIAGESSFDVLEQDAASNNGVDDIRQLLDQVQYPPQFGKYKVYIIDEVHMLSAAAFNALLKTLEEPPSYMVFILATTEPQRLPATILSRVQRYDFGRLDSRLMVGRMREALAQLGLPAEDEALSLIARAAEGAMRDAFSILDMCVSGAEDGCVTAQGVHRVLGTSDQGFVFDFAEQIRQGSAEGILRRMDELMRSGREPQVFLKELTRHFRALLATKAVTGDVAALLDVTDEQAAQYREQAESFSQERLLRVLGVLMRAEGELRFASSPRVGVEVAALTACQPADGENGEAMRERIAELEGQLQALQTKLQSGQFAAAPTTKASAAPKRTATSAAVKPAPPVEPPKDEKEAWQRLLDTLKKTDPPMFGLLRTERFIGAKGSVYQLLIPLSKKDFTYLKLNQPARKEKLSALLTEIVGFPCQFEPVLESMDEQQQSQQNSVQEMLIDAFGREVVQVDDQAEDHPF